MAFSPVRRSAVDSSKKLLGLPVLALAGVIFLAGCHPAVTDPNDPKFLVAEKTGTDGWKITEGELEKEVSDYLKQNHATPEQVGPAKMPVLRTAMLKNMVLRKLLLAKAAKLNLKSADIDKEVNDQIDRVKGTMSDADFTAQLKTAGLSQDDLKTRLREKAEVQEVFKAEAFKNLDPTDQEINDIYLKNKESFNIPAKVRASRVLILVDDKTSPTDKTAKKKTIDAARARVAKGEDFAKVATEVSEDRYSAPRGGDINFFQKGENEPGFDDVAFNTKVGVLSPVFQTSLGYQFLKVTAVQPAGIVPVADARGYISSKLREMKMQQQEQDYAKKLLTDPTVAYHITLIDPPAQTAMPNGPGAPDNAAPADTSAPPADAGQAPAPDQTVPSAPAPAPAPEQAPAPAPAEAPAPAPSK